MLKLFVMSLGFGIPSEQFVAVPIPHPLDGAIQAAVLVSEGQPFGVEVHAGRVVAGHWWARPAALAKGD